MFLKAIPGLRVPQEFYPQRYITDAEITKVDESAYYLRRISDGDAIEVAEAEWNLQEQKRIDDEVAAIKAAEAEAKAKAKAEKTALTNN